MAGDEDWRAVASFRGMRPCLPFVLVGTHDVHAAGSSPTLESIEAATQSAHRSSPSDSSNSRRIGSGAVCSTSYPRTLASSSVIPSGT